MNQKTLDAEVKRVAEALGLSEKQGYELQWWAHAIYYDRIEKARQFFTGQETQSTLGGGGS